MAQSVCIVGAGPAGLAVAKTLLYNTPKRDFTVTVFDAQHDVGGLWPTSKSDTGRQIHPLMTTNLSRHSVHFSDLAWDDKTPQFPQAWMVGQYLQRYATKYLVNNPDFKLHLKSVVTSAERHEKGWSVTIRSHTGEKTSCFHRLIVASGYFGKPVLPCSIRQEATIPVIHSSQYRDLQSLLGNINRGRKILVAGGQMSGVEITATIATHLSNAINSPESSTIPDIEKFSIHHASPCQPWVIPLHTTPEPSWKAPPFLPHDLSSFNRSNRPLPLSNSHGHISEEAADILHTRLHSSLGSKQALEADTTIPNSKARLQPPYLACSDWYCEFVRSGLITVHRGRLDAIAGSCAKLTDSSIDDVAAVVLATGFDPGPCVTFLPRDVLSIIRYSPAHPSLLLALAFHGTHHPDVPRLGFVGFYRGAYWGVIQMQARFLAELWSNKGQSQVLRQKLAQDDSIQQVLALRNDGRLSQFPMGDYPFLMQEFAEALSIPIIPIVATDTPKLTTNGLALEFLTPSRYSPPNEDCQDNVNSMTLLQDTASVLKSGLTTSRFVSRAVFRSLLGTWNLERRIESKLPTYPSGRFSGTAQFLLRQQTKEGVRCTADDGETPLCDESERYEYLYVEEGEFKTNGGFSLRASRRYIYRYEDAADVITVWFARPDDSKRVDYFFHEIQFESPPAGGGGYEHGWPAKSGHLCVDDYYNVRYNFAFAQVNLDSWDCAYTVNGPEKDYTILGTYTR